MCFSKSKQSTQFCTVNSETATSLDKLQSTHVKLDQAFLSQKTNVALSTNRSQVKEVLPTGQVCAELSVLGIQ